MNKGMKWIEIPLAVALLFAASAMATNATTLRAYVSSTGNDSNAGANCPQITPCRTFAGAYPTVTPGGELIALDTAGYGPLNGAAFINKAITVAAVPGATAFVVVTAGFHGFAITAAASDQITVRNVSFNGSGATNTDGIQLNSGNLVVENCTFTQLTIAGIRAVAGTTFIRNSTFIGNAGRGIYASNTGKVNAENITVVNNGTGITVDGNCANTLVRIDSGSVVSNTLGFEMLNGVCSPNSGALAQNIFLRADGAQRVNVIGNTTVVGPSPGAGNSATVGTYLSSLSTSY